MPQNTGSNTAVCLLWMISDRDLSFGATVIGVCGLSKDKILLSAGRNIA